MKQFKGILLFLTISGILLSCKEQMSESDRRAARKGTENQEIKRVNEADIIAEGLRRGDSISMITQKVLGSTLKSKIEMNGTADALQYCNVNAYPITDSLASIFTASIRRVSLKTRNPQNTPDSLESSLLEAYQYSVENGDPVGSNIHDTGEDYLLYTKPILVGDPLCLQCHGEENKDVSTNTLQLIRELYPEDKATGYSITEMRGMWSIRLDRKEIVNSL